MFENKKYSKNRYARPFNSPLECGLRALFILDASQSAPMDLQRIIAYDYLLVHSGDIENGPPSLHPAVPHRGTELLVRRQAVQAGLNQMIAKELARIEFMPQGFLYRSTDLTSAFISLLKSPYAFQLKNRAEWINENFCSYSDQDLSSYIARNVGRWGAEFEFLTAVDFLEL